MSGILYGALLPRDVVLGLDNSAREPTCHSSPYLGQFMLLWKLAEPFSDLLLGTMLSKLYSGWICKALSFNFPNLWKLSAWKWIERISWENCAQGYRWDFFPACIGFQWSILSSGPCILGTFAKAVLPSGAWSERRTDFGALYMTMWWTGLPAFWFWAELSRKKIILHVNQGISVYMNQQEPTAAEVYKSIQFTYQTGIRLKRSNLIRTVIKAKWHFE